VVETELGLVRLNKAVFFLQFTSSSLDFLNVPPYYCICLSLLTVGSTLNKLVVRQFGAVS